MKLLDDFVDDSWRAPLRAARREARSQGAFACGSEHALLGLLQLRHPATVALTEAYPALTLQTLRAAIDEPPAPGTRGLAAENPPTTRTPDADAASATRRMAHTAEFQHALNEVSHKSYHLGRQGVLLSSQPSSAADLWLVVLEPGTRSAKLLDAIGVDRDAARALMLSHLRPGRDTTVSWPAAFAQGPLIRLGHRFLLYIKVDRPRRRHARPHTPAGRR